MASSTQTRKRSRSRFAADDAPIGDESNLDELDQPFGSTLRPSTKGRHRRNVLSALKELPHFLKLLFGLITDSRVSATDKVLVAGAVAYLVSPIDLIPDFIPFLGELDDLFILILALRRLINHAPRRVVLDHWPGNPDDLDDLRLERVLASLAFFLPKRLRRRLRILGRV